MKLKSCFILAGILIITADILAQSLNIGHTSITFYDKSRNRNITTEVYYPADKSGENVPITTGNYPIIVFGHGFVMNWKSYQNFWDELVPKGYVICFPTTEMGLFPSHQNFGRDLKFVATQMQNENVNDNSIFFNSLSPKTALMGHSMGGGASVLAAENNSSISTLICFAPAETNPSAISAASNTTIPSLIFSGEDDCVAPPKKHQNLIYEGLNASCKTHISIINGGHCYFANYNFNCAFGESSCNPSPNITRAEQQTTTFDFLKLWLDYSLYDNPNSFDAFNDSLRTSTRINNEQFCHTTDIHAIRNQNGVKIYPNPVVDMLNLEFGEGDTGGLLVIYNTLGEKVYQQLVNSCGWQVNMCKFAPGAYFVLYINGSFKYSSVVVKFKD